MPYSVKCFANVKKTTLIEIVPQEVLWSIWGSHQTLCSLPLPNVTWHSGTWPCTMTPSIDQTLHKFATLLPNLTLLQILTLLPNFGGFHRTLQRVRLVNRGRLLLRTPGHVPFGTCICSRLEVLTSIFILYQNCTVLATKYPGFFLIQNTRSLFYGGHYSSLHRLMSLHGKMDVKIFLMFIVAENTRSVNILIPKSFRWHL